MKGACNDALCSGCFDRYHLGSARRKSSLSRPRTPSITAGIGNRTAIWWYEIRNVLLLNERRDRIAAEDSIQFLAALDLMRIDVDFSKDSAEVIGIARKYGLSVYDAAYLALAIREYLPLATLDTALQAAAHAAGVPQLG